MCVIKFIFVNFCIFFLALFYFLQADFLLFFHEVHRCIKKLQAFYVIY